VSAYERILNACGGDEEQAELIAAQVARVIPLDRQGQEASSSAKVAHSPRSLPAGLEADLMTAIAKVLEAWKP